jgi:hypothetical protein
MSQERTAKNDAKNLLLRLIKLKLMLQGNVGFAPTSVVYCSARRKTMLKTCFQGNVGFAPTSIVNLDPTLGPSDIL